MHVLITGASSGIGEATARAYLQSGASVTLVARRRELLESIVKEMDASRVHLVTCDLATLTDAAALLDEAEARLGPIDVLVNNAGVQIVAEAQDTKWDDAERMLRLNVFTPLRLTHTLLPRMIGRGKGTIVDIASMAALSPTPGMFFYNASKGALAAASEGLRAEVKPYGVHVVTVYPGPVKSAMEVAGRAAYEHSALANSIPTGDPDVLANLIIRAVERKCARIIYPRFYGLARLFPNLNRWFVDTFTPRTKRPGRAN